MSTNQPLVRIAGDYLVISAPWGSYDPLLEQFRREPTDWLWQMREKNWWTAEHERELVNVLGQEWMKQALEGMQHERGA